MDVYSRHTEASLNEKGYSAKGEKRVLDALGRGLLREFPNPERIGCPPSEVLKGMASHAVPLAEAEKWLEHLGSCSPCYRDFSRLQKTHQLRRNRTLLAIAASILVCASIGGWALVHWHNRNETVQTAVLDLRNWSVTRGAEPNPNLPPVKLSRRASSLTILLPVGSAAGAYEVRIVMRSGNPVLEANGSAEFENGITGLRVLVDLRSLSPGSYVLEIRRGDLGWNSYPLVLR